MTLSGDKLWVTNGANVDIFIVWAKQISKYADGGAPTPRLTAVLVDAKNSAGITVSEHNYPTRGLKGCGFKSVKFEDVSIYVVQTIKLVLVINYRLHWLQKKTYTGCPVN